MASLIGFFIFILVCAAILGGIVGLVSRLQRPRQPRIDANWQPPKADRLPYSKKKYFFSAAERSFYEILKRLAPADHTVFAKVRLADVVYVNKETSERQSHFNRISGKHVDFLICNKDLAPVCLRSSSTMHHTVKRIDSHGITLSIRRSLRRLCPCFVFRQDEAM